MSAANPAAHGIAAGDADARSPFHEGERRVQERLGVRETIEPFARRVVRSHLPDEHRQFYAALPFVVAAARDRRGRPWATLISEEPGFVASPDPRTLRIAALPSAGDALASAFRTGADVGLLGIELHTRRRNRMNGTLRAALDGGFELEVGQSFGNCPQYIVERRWRRAPRRTARPVRIGPRLTERQQAWIDEADTFFIATGHRGEGSDRAFGLDASHRGGPPGFVQAAEAELVFPDYAGNNHFNTLGNLELDPRAGLVFVDFRSGSLLQITGRARVEWGRERRVRFEVDCVIEQPGALPLRFEEPGADTRPYRVVATVQESRDVRSLHLEPADGEDRPGAVAGQHLPIEVELPDGATLRRTYSLSGPPREGLRITVKREPDGRVSNHLHDAIRVGDELRAGRPAGEFVLPTGGVRPIVLASAGVGVTPMAAMLHELAGRSDRDVWLVHGARNGRHHPLREELRELATRSARVRVVTAYSRPDRSDRIGRDYDLPGRVQPSLVEELVPDLSAEFFLCGPTGFLAEMWNGLLSRGVPPERVHVESFGGAGS